MADITLEGNPIHTNGDLPAVGTMAPDFRLVAKDLSDLSLADFAGKKKLLNIVPSLDTGVCATSTKVFNERLGGRGDVVVIVARPICRSPRTVSARPRAPPMCAPCR